LIYKIAWLHVKNYPGFEFDDLVSEACIAYLESMRHYDPRRGKKSTFLWHVVQNRLNTIIRNEIAKTRKECIYIDELREIVDDSSNPEQRLLANECWGEMINNFSPEAKTICDIVFKETRIYLPVDKPKHCRGVIVRELRSRGWSWGCIWNAMREIKEAVLATY